jgi:WD40 repeat protein
MVSPLRAGFVSHEQGSSTSVIQFSHLPTLSAQVTGDKARSLWGLPTCISVHSKIVACGTSLGCVVLFDHFEGFRWMVCLAFVFTLVMLRHRMVLGATSQGERVDPITCLCISPSGDWLLAAHSSGRSVVWDTVRGKEEKIMNEHSAAVLHACFLDDRNIVTADSLGLVLRITITHVFFTWRFSISKIFDTTPPSLGRIQAMRPLESNASAPHPSSSSEMMAMATASMFFVVSLKPDLVMLFKEPRPPTVCANLLP